MNINQYLSAKLVKKVVLLRIASLIPEKKINYLKNCFEKMDKDGSG